MRVNIYIRNENQEKWDDIPDKSNWVNTLLEHMDDTSRLGLERPSPIGPIVEVLSEEVGGSSVPSEPEDILGPKIIEPAVPFKVEPGNIRIKPERISNGLCKIHGTPLTAFGKCLQKGCKYA